MNKQVSAACWGMNAADSVLPESSNPYLASDARTAWMRAYQRTIIGSRASQAVYTNLDRLTRKLKDQHDTQLFL